MHRRLATTVITLIVSIAAVLAPGCGRGANVVPMATTTTIEGSGLLAVLLPAMKSDLGLDIEAVTVASSGRSRSSIAVTPTSASRTIPTRNVPREKGTFGDYRKVMCNDFVIAGPAADPAKIKDATSASDAMGRIAGSTVAFPRAPIPPARTRANCFSGSRPAVDPPASVSSKPARVCRPHFELHPNVRPTC